MSTIPVSVTEKQFNEHIRPSLSIAKRGYACKIPRHISFMVCSLVGARRAVRLQAKNHAKV